MSETIHVNVRIGDENCIFACPEAWLESFDKIVKGIYDHPANEYMETYCWYCVNGLQDNHNWCEYVARRYERISKETIRKMVVEQLCGARDRYLAKQSLVG